MERRVLLPTALVAEIGLAILVSALPIAIGGVHRSVQIAAGIASALVLAAVAYHRWLTRQPFRFFLFGGLLIGLTAYTAVQAIPLPIRLLRALSPRSVELLGISLGGLSSMPSWHPISLEPGNTWWEVLKLGTVTATFLAAANLLGRKERRTRIMLVLAATGALLSLLGFIGAVVAPHRPLLFYKPSSGSATGLITTSFVNPNHGSAFLTICTMITIGLALRQRDLQRRVLLALASVLLGASVFLTLSRGGIMALGFALGLFAFLLWNRPRGDVDSSRQAALLAATLGCTIALAGWLAYDGIASELATLLPGSPPVGGKVEIWPAGLAMIGKNWLVGIGRGAMASALPRYFTDHVPQVSYSHLENQYLHLPAEWGLLVGSAAIAGGIVAWVSWLRREEKDPLHLAVVAALAAVALHNAVDFSLELTGIAVPMAALAGTLAARGQSRLNGSEVMRDAKIPGRGRGSIVYTIAAIIVIGAITLAWSDPQSPDQDASQLVRMIEQRPKFDHFQRAAVSAIRRHPADYLFPMLIAREAYAARRPETLRWLNQAMALFPQSPDIHLQTAQAMQRFGRLGQSLLHARLAMIYGAPPGTVLSWALPMCRSKADLLRLVPQRAELQQLAVAWLLENQRTELAWQYAQYARKEFPSDPGLIAAEVRVRLALGESSEARDVAERLAREYPTEEHYRLWAAASEKAGGLAEGTKILERAVERFSGKLDPMFDLALMYARARNFERAAKVANSALALAEDPAFLARAHSVLSEIYRAAGRAHRADYEAERAHRLSESPGPGM